MGLMNVGNPSPTSSVARPARIMDPRLIYVAKPPTPRAPLWNPERNRCPPSLPSVCSNCCRTVEESLPVPHKPCTYGPVGNGRPSPSTRVGRRSWTAPLPSPLSKTTPIIFTKDADYGAVGDGPPGRPAERSTSHSTHSLITNDKTPAPSSLQPGDLIYLTTPQGPRYYYGWRLVNDNSANHIPIAQSRSRKRVADCNSRESSI